MQSPHLVQNHLVQKSDKEPEVQRLIRWRWWYTALPVMTSSLTYWSFRLGFVHGHGLQPAIFYSEVFLSLAGGWQAVSVWQLVARGSATASPEGETCVDEKVWPPAPKRL